MKRILHVVGRMDRAGQETFLMNLLRSIDSTKYEFTFSVNTNRIGEYEPEIKELGGYIWHNPYTPKPKDLYKYLRAFRKFLIKEGPFDVIHCHVYLFSGFLLRVAAQCGIPVRIMHSHSTSDGYKNTFLRKLYRDFCYRIIKKYSTHLVACGEDAYESFYRSKSPNKYYILNNGIILEKFNLNEVAKYKVKKSLGIPNNYKVIISVARFSEVKNHKKIISIFKSYISEFPNTYMILIGEGELKDKMERFCRELCISDKVKFLGVRNDIPRLMNSSDVLLMPSLYEGLPVTLIEAQAVGLPCAISSTISQEVDLKLGLIKFIPLEEPDSLWVREIEALMSNIKPSFLERENALCKSGYTINATWDKLKKIYE